MVKLINIYGAPGAGKSTSASGLFFELKKKGYKVELAYEWIKFKVYEGTPYPFQDQIYAFAKQNKQIAQLKNHVDYIITDSPLLMSLHYGKNLPKSFQQLVLDCYNNYENYNFLVKRNHAYQDCGRLQSEQESDAMQKEIEDVLKNNGIPYVVLNSNECVSRIISDLNL